MLRNEDGHDGKRYELIVTGAGTAACVTTMGCSKAEWSVQPSASRVLDLDSSGGLTKAADATQIKNAMVFCPAGICAAGS